MTTTPLNGGRMTAGEAAVTSRQGFDLDELRSIVEVEVSLEEFPLADAVADRALVYRTEDLRGCLRDIDQAAAARNELTRALHDGPGVIVITGAGRSDHYAKPGTNDRLWNALEKLAVEDPEAFVDYHGCDMIDLASLA